MAFPGTINQVCKVKPFDSTVDVGKFFDWYPELRLTKATLDGLSASDPKKVRSRKKSDKFEIGLAMAGSVSAGAYSAGVLDFLVEALDAWAENGGKGNIPKLDVAVTTAAGTSGGGICVGLLAQACRYDHKPVKKQPSDEQYGKTFNPFFRVWSDVSIEELLTNSDKPDWSSASDRDDIPPSFLNGRALGKAAHRLIVKWPAEAKLKARAMFPEWLDERLRLYVTLGNSTGIPYQIRFKGASSALQGHQMTMHVDYAGFDLREKMSPTDLSPPDIYALQWDDVLGVIDGQDMQIASKEWELFRRTLLGTGAFPIALPPQEIAIDPNAYTWRFAYISSQGEHIWAEPWPERETTSGNLTALDPSGYTLFCHDGGAYNNEPIEPVIRSMFGSDGPLEGDDDGESSERAVIIIDPLIGASLESQLRGGADSGPTEAQQTLVKMFGEKFGRRFGLSSLVSYVLGIYNQTRFKQIDLTLADADDVFSRFLISPTAKCKIDGQQRTIRGTAALTSGGFRAFAGFFSRVQTWYDFQLGRRNCREFLLKTFVLPEKNPVIQKRLKNLRTKVKRDAFLKQAESVAGKSADGTQVMVPIIPVLDIIKAGEKLEKIDLEPAIKALTRANKDLDNRVEKYVDGFNNFVDQFVRDSRNLFGAGIINLYLELGFRSIEKAIRNFIQSELQRAAEDLEQRGTQQWEADDGGKGFR